MPVHITIALRVGIGFKEGKKIIILFEDRHQGKLNPTIRSKYQPTSGDLAQFFYTVQPWLKWMHAVVPSFLISQHWHDVISYKLHYRELHCQVRKLFPVSSNFTCLCWAGCISFLNLMQPTGQRLDIITGSRLSALGCRNHFLDQLTPTEHSWHQRLCLVDSPMSG